MAGFFNPGKLYRVFSRLLWYEHIHRTDSFPASFCEFYLADGAKKAGTRAPAFSQSFSDEIISRQKGEQSVLNSLGIYSN